MPYLIVKASESDAATLTDLAIRSEAHWNLATDLMARFRELYSVTPGFIKQNHVFKLICGDSISGFFALVPASQTGILEYFYLDPSNIGHGLGKMMWIETVKMSSNLGFHSIELVCGPEPLKFYLKQGAIVINQEQSKLSQDRVIFKLRYTLNPEII